MNKVVIILFLCSVPFGIYSFFDLLVDADSYFFLNQVCFGDLVFNQFSAFPLLIQFFPCSVLFAKFFLFVVFFLSVFVVSKIGELFDKERGWLVGLIFFSFTFSIIEFFKFENDAVGYLFGFVAFYFLIKHYLKYPKSLSISVYLILSGIYFTLSGLFWNGAVYWLFFAAPFLNPFYAISIIIPLKYSESFFWFFFPNPIIQEHQSFVSIIYLGLTVIFFIGAIKTDKKIFFAAIATLIPALFVSKLFVLPALFFSLIAFNGVKIIFKDHMEIFEPTLIIFCIFVGLMFGSWSFTNFPNQSDIELIKEVVETSPELNNDFSTGYIIEHYGGKPNCKGGYCDVNYSGYVLGLSKDGNMNCQEIKDNNRFIYLKCPQ